MKPLVSNSEPIVILLTGTIIPNSTTTLTVKDPEVRQDQYLNSILFYLQQTSLKIVFVENSNADLKKFPKISERIEYHSFNAKRGNADRGKGFKELEIMNYALNHSRFLKEAASVIKITGRLKLLNINQITSDFLKLNKKYPRLVYADPFAEGNIDARCFIFTKDFWPFLKKAGENTDQRYNFELTLWDAISKYESIDENLFKSIKLPLRIQGISGSFGNAYNHNLIIHYVRYLRKIVYRLFKKEKLTNLNRLDSKN